MKKNVETSGSITSQIIEVIFEYSSEASENVLKNYAKYSGTLRRQTKEKLNELTGSTENENIPAREITVFKGALSAAIAVTFNPSMYHDFDL